MKADHRVALQQEQTRAAEAEEQLSVLSSQSEERVASLEAKLSELSEVTGNYERLRYQDQMNIQKLRERISQLDLENTALAKAAGGGAKAGSPAHTGKEAESAEDEQLDVQDMIEKIIRLKAKLKVANEKSEKPVNIEGTG